MRTFFILLTLLFSSTVFSQTVEKNKPYSISYRDSDDTYIQLTFIDSVTGKELNLNVALKFNSKDDEKNSFNLSLLYDENQRSIPIKCSSGNFEMFNKELLKEEIELAAGKLNQIRFYLKWATLQFRRRGGALLSPGYTAVITKKFEEGKSVNQACEVAKAYEPGVYRIEINSLPVFKATVQLDYGSIYEIQINPFAYLTLKTFEETSDIEIEYQLNQLWIPLPVNANNVSIYPLKLEARSYRVRWKYHGKKLEKLIRLKADERFVLACKDRTLD